MGGTTVKKMVRSLINPLRTRWTIAVREGAFVRDALRRFVQVLGGEHRPSNRDIVEIRADLLRSQWIVQAILTGVKELKAAAEARIEHFSQSDYHAFARVEDVVAGSARAQAHPSAA